jgi:hypothetical protein
MGMGAVPGARQRHDLQRKTRQYIAGYDKHLDFEQLSPEEIVDVA